MRDKRDAWSTTWRCLLTVNAMAGYLWFVIVVVAVLATVVLAVAWRMRRRQPTTTEDKLRAAQAAARAIRRSSPRAHRDTFERGRGVPDRHSAAIAENVTYGEAAHGGGWESSSSGASGD